MLIIIIIFIIVIVTFCAHCDSWNFDKSQPNIQRAPSNILETPQQIFPNAFDKYSAESAILYFLPMKVKDSCLIDGSCAHCGSSTFDLIYVKSPKNTDSHMLTIINAIKKSSSFLYHLRPKKEISFEKADTINKISCGLSSLSSKLDSGAKLCVYPIVFNQAKERYFTN